MAARRSAFAHRLAYDLIPHHAEAIFYMCVPAVLVNPDQLACQARVTDTRDLEAISRLAASDSSVPDLPSLRRVSPLLSSPSRTSFFLKPPALLSPPFRLFAVP